MFVVEREQTQLLEEDQARILYVISQYVFKLQKLLTCSICFELFKRPLTGLKCFHIFCEECIQTYLTFCTSKIPPCPICQKSILPNKLHIDNDVATAVSVVTTALEQMKTNLDLTFVKSPSFQNVLAKMVENGEVNNCAQDGEDGINLNDQQALDCNLILKSKKMLMGPNGKIISLVKELPPEYVIFKDGSIKTPLKRKLKTETANADINQESPDNLKEVIIKTSVQKQPQQIEEQENNKLFDGELNNREVLMWLQDCKRFSLKPRTQESCVSELQTQSDFDMPSVSQICNHKKDPVTAPSCSKAIKQNIELIPIQQQGQIIPRLAQGNKQNYNRLTRSLQSDTIKTIAKPNSKRNSIAAGKNLDQNVSIEQFTSEDEVVVKGFENSETIAFVDLVEEEGLENSDSELIQQNKLKRPKRNKRNFSVDIEQTNKRLSKDKDSSGWIRMKQIKKTIGKVERKPFKLTVSGMSRTSTVVSNCSKVLENVNKVNHTEVVETDISEKVSTLKELVVVLEKFDRNFDNKGSDNQYESRTYDAKTVESYLSKNINDPFTSEKHKTSVEREIDVIQQGDSCIADISNTNKKNKLSVPSKLQLNGFNRVTKEKDEKLRSFINGTHEIEKEILQSKNAEPKIKLSQTEETTVDFKKPAGSSWLKNNVGQHTEEKDKTPITVTEKETLKLKSSESKNNLSYIVKEQDKLTPSPKHKVEQEKSETKGLSQTTEENSKLPTLTSPCKSLKENYSNNISTESNDHLDLVKSDGTTKNIDDGVFVNSMQASMDRVNQKQKEVGDDDDIFSLPTQVINIPSTEQVASKEKLLENDLKRQIESLSIIVNTFKRNISSSHLMPFVSTEQTQRNLIAKMKAVLNDIERTACGEKESCLMKDMTVQTEYPKDISTFFLANVTTQTLCLEEKFKNAAVQTNSGNSSRGFRISSTDMFNTQPVTNAEMQTDAMVCPKCDYVITNDTKSCFKSKTSEKYVLTGSFDNIDFETQDVIKGKHIKGSFSRNNSEISQKPNVAVVSKINESNETENKTESKKPVTPREKINDPRLMRKSQVPSTSALSQSSKAKVPMKKTFKRIREPSSDSDCDERASSNKKNKFIQDDLSLYFASEEPQKEITQSSDKIEGEKNEFALSEGSEGINYGEYLENVLKKCEDEEQFHKKTPQQKKTSVKPCAKSSKTQDMIKECEMIIQEACSGAIILENTESCNFNIPDNNVKQDIPGTSKLTLAALEEEFQHNFSGDEGDDVAKGEERSTSIRKKLFAVEESKKVMENENKFSESLFANTDDNSVLSVPLEEQNDGRDNVCSSKSILGTQKKINKTRKMTNDALLLASGMKLTDEYLHELVEVFKEMHENDSFDDKMELDSELNAGNGNDIISSNNEVAKVQNEDKINVLQDISIFKNNIIVNKDSTNFMEKCKVAPTVNIEEDKIINDNASNKSDDMFLSDSDVVETTPQKSKPEALERLSLLSQVYYNPDAGIILPTLVNKSSQWVSSCLQQTFTPPPEFQDTDKTLVNEVISISADCNENDETIVEIPIDINKNVSPQSSLTPSLMLPPNSPTNDLPKKNLITSTPYTQKSRVTPVRSLNLSPISAVEAYSGINPIRAAQNSKFSPLTIVKSQTPPPEIPSSVITSTPKQKSILNYVQQNDNLNRSSAKNFPSSQSSQKSIQELTSRPCVACTRLTNKEILAIVSLSQKKLVTFSDVYSPRVTHMIVCVNEDNMVTDLTMKYILAVASGIWVVSFDWVEECLKQGRLLPEEPFEAIDVSGVIGPRNSRLTRNDAPLLRGYQIHAANPFQSTTQREVENLLKLLGSEVVPRPEDLVPNKGKICLIIAEAKKSEDDIYDKWFEEFNVITVDLEWLSRSTGQYERQSVLPYMLCDALISDLDYPAELLADGPSYMYSTDTLYTI